MLTKINDDLWMDDELINNIKWCNKIGKNEYAIVISKPNCPPSNIVITREQMKALEPHLQTKENK